MSMVPVIEGEGQASGAGTGSGGSQQPTRWQRACSSSSFCLCSSSFISVARIADCWSKSCRFCLASSKRRSSTNCFAVASMLAFIARNSFCSRSLCSIADREGERSISPGEIKEAWLCAAGVADAGERVAAAPWSVQRM